MNKKVVRWDDLNKDQLLDKFKKMASSKRDVEALNTKEHACRLCEKPVKTGQHYAIVSGQAHRIAHESCIAKPRIWRDAAPETKQAAVAYLETDKPFVPSAKLVDKRGDAIVVPEFEAETIDQRVLDLQIELALATAYQQGLADARKQLVAR